MASANFNGIGTVFGPKEVDKMKGCEWHFTESIRKKKAGMDLDIGSTFEKYAKAMLNSASPVSYDVAYQAMFTLLSTTPEIISCLDWLEYWHRRRGFMFRAFSSIDAPNSNLAEVVHAGWKNSAEIKLSILAATYYDLKASLIFNQEMQDHREGIYDGGKYSTYHFLYWVDACLLIGLNKRCD